MNKTLPKQSLTSFLKDLRKILGPDVKKVEPFVYIVNKRVRVEVVYFCRSILYDDKQKEISKVSKECLPSRINISAYTEYVKKAIGMRDWEHPSRLPKPTVARKTKQDTFNYESIAVKVTQLGERVDKWIFEYKESQRKESDRQKLKKQLQDKLAEYLKPLKLSNRGSSTHQSLNNKVYIDLVGPDTEGNHYYQVTFDELSFDQMRTLRNTIFQISDWPKLEEIPD